MLYLDQQGVAKQREYNFLIYISCIYQINMQSQKIFTPTPTMEGSFALDPHLLEFP